MRRWHGNIKINFTEIHHEDVNWIEVGQDSVQWKLCINDAEPSGSFSSHLVNYIGTGIPLITVAFPGQSSFHQCPIFTYNNI
jgi:hypothetical protein